MEEHCNAVDIPVETANETIPQRGLGLHLAATFFGAESASVLREPDAESESGPSKSLQPSVGGRLTVHESSARGAATVGSALERRGDRA